MSKKMKYSKPHLVPLGDEQDSASGACSAGYSGGAGCSNGGTAQQAPGCWTGTNASPGAECWSGGPAGGVS